ncbi:MAG: transglutaminase family protein [Synechococcaceae cyanobacterium]|nr:transglutaminase family protein [Synechococcaceae cyanobacterium]
MQFRIRHELQYTYDRPVFLEPMTVRLTPRQDSTQRLLEHRLDLDPAPRGRSAVLDAEGGPAEICWFHEEQGGLRIAVESRVQTLRANPFDWILTQADQQRLPLTYASAEALSLAGCLTDPAAIDAGVRRWAAELAAEAEQHTPDFLLLLADRIHHGFQHEGRLEGEPMAAAETLALRRGACRDTAMLFIEACRSQGLAARFVSGYSRHHPPEVSEHELHAWAEVYLAGGGWRGYDPSLGLAVADGHVALTAAPDHRRAAPVCGRYRGTGVASRLDYRVEVRAWPDQ